MRESGHILLEGAPQGFDARAVAADLTEEISGVARVHHVYAWSITEERPVTTLEAEVVPGTDQHTIRDVLKSRLAERFGVGHATVEIHEKHADPAQPSSEGTKKMSGNFIIWIPVLLAAVWAAHWGAEHLSDPLKKLRRQWGFSVAAGGAFVGLAAASPEIGINTTSAIRGVGDIGLGALLGSNVLAIPMMVVTAYVATRKRGIGEKGGHEHLLQVDPQAVTVQALPYLAIISLFALLALPEPWRGLQPIDGWVLLLGYLVYVVQALMRGRKDGEDVDWKRKEKWQAAAGLGALAVGAYFTVLSTEKIVAGLGISKIIGGLFITAPVAALPEVFATWYVARSGQVTSGVTSVIGDHAVTMTLAFIPLTIVGMPIENMQLFWVTLAFVALMPALYAAFIWWGGRERGFRRWQVLLLPAVYALFVAVMVFWVQPFGQGAQGGSGTAASAQQQATSPGRSGGS